MMKRDIKNLRILYVETDEISLRDIPRCLDELGYDVYRAALEIKAQEYDEAAFRKLETAIDKLHADCAISYDFVPTIAQACLEADVPYIAWVYDCPQRELYTHYALYPGNYIFAFDKSQVQDLRKTGIKHAVLTPLAVHAKKVQLFQERINGKGGKKYENEIAFVGQLYKLENLDVVAEQMPDEIKTQLHQDIDRCFLKWEKGKRFHGNLNGKCTEYLGGLEQHKIEKELPYISEQHYYEAAFLSRILANQERVYVLNQLAEKYDVKFYTRDKDTSQLSRKVKVLPGVNYDGLWDIYAKSKININLTLHCIETGACQRVFDVLAAGGFLLTNYQEELEELFIPGEELVFYHNEQELQELTEYYMTHEEEREQIAKRGQKKVLERYVYEKELPEAIEYVMAQEKERKESYLQSQQNILRRQADYFLAQGTREAYQKLYDMYTDDLYQVAVRKDNAVGTLREMLECWKMEQKLEGTCVFAGVKNTEEAERKYVRLLHSLWRMEQNLSYEKCIESMNYIQREDISHFFVAWVINANLRDKEETMVKVASALAGNSITEAIEFLSYGLLFYPKAEKLLTEQASYFMDLSLWKNALETLQKIENPSGEIREIMGELERAFQG